MYPVKGQVLLADGKPLQMGRVVFFRNEVPPIALSGDIQPDGRFELASTALGNGAPAGNYRVKIDPNSVPDLGARPSAKIPRIPRKYTEEDGVGLAVTVKAESNELRPFLLK
jgi:hypothetical protein